MPPSRSRLRDVPSPEMRRYLIESPAADVVNAMVERNRAAAARMRGGGAWHETAEGGRRSFNYYAATRRAKVAAMHFADVQPAAGGGFTMRTREQLVVRARWRVRVDQELRFSEPEPGRTVVSVGTVTGAVRLRGGRGRDGHPMPRRATEGMRALTARRLGHEMAGVARQLGTTGRSL